MQYQTQHGLVELIDFLFFFLRTLMGIQCKAGRGCQR